MASFNKVILMGNLTRDPEIRYTPKGTALTEIGMAVNRRYQLENEWKEEVTYIDITFWGKVGEIVAQYCKKGRPLHVEGRLHYDAWDDKTTGQKRSRLRVIGENIQLLGSRDGAGGGSGEGGGGGGGGSESSPERPAAAEPSRPASAPATSAPAEPKRPPFEEEEDQIPF